MKIKRQGELKKELGFTMIPNSLFDEDLRASEKLLLAYLKRQKNGYVITKIQIANALNLSRTTVNRLLESLHEKRFIQLDDDHQNLFIKDDLSQFEVSSDDLSTSNNATSDTSTGDTSTSTDDTLTSTYDTLNVQQLNIYKNNKTIDNTYNKTSKKAGVASSSISSNQLKETSELNPEEGSISNDHLVNQIINISQLPPNYQKAYYWALTTYLQEKYPIQYEEKRMENNCKMPLDIFTSNLKRSGIHMDLNGKYNQPEIQSINELVSTEIKQTLFEDIRKDYLKHINEA